MKKDHRTSCIYAEYFGITDDPFGLTPDPEFFMLSQSHSTALEWMTYAIEQHEMGLVLGEIGSGKTVLSRMLVDSLEDKENYRVSWIINPQLSPSGLLKEIYRQLFDEKPKYFKRDIIRQLLDGLTELFLEGIFPVLIIDEAQMIPTKSVFDEIRMLCNYQTDKQNLISIILLGQPELESRLKRPAYRALVQRIRFSTKLLPLKDEEVSVYLLHRLQKAGYNGSNPFLDHAVRKMIDLTEGQPRALNHLASFTLMEVMMNGQTQASELHVENASKNINYLNWAK